MDSLLDAFQEGRLIELPDNNKQHALQFLAHIIEAIPSLPPGLDMVGLVMEREMTADTSLSKGWACPHDRVPFEEDLICVVGWSPQGIDYGARDGMAVKIVAMYLVPENQRNHYLREVSLLAKALQIFPDLEKLNSAKNLNEVRALMLDLISSAKMAIGPDSRARMIKLQARPTAAEEVAYHLANLVIEPVTIVAAPGLRPLVLAQNSLLSESLDSNPGVIDSLASQGVFQNSDWQVIRRSTTMFPGNKVLYDCLAIKLTRSNSSQ